MDQFHPSDLQEALAATCEVLRPLDPALDGEWLIDRMLETITLITPGLSEDQAMRWTVIAIKRLAGLPAMLVDEALDDVFGRYGFAGEVVPKLLDLTESSEKTVRAFAVGLERMVEAAAG